MKKMVLSNFNYMDTYNAVVGGIVACLTLIFGEHWILFAGFLLFNIVDFITGIMKSKLAGKENSTKGWQGVLKKLGYWIMILIAFIMATLFIDIGKAINVDLGVTTLLGWFVLASLTINEIRSILENLVQAGYNVPSILINGLEVAEKIINKESEEEKNE